MEKIDGWQLIWSQIKLNFLWLIEDLLKIISTKFCGNWTCTLAFTISYVKCTESVHKRELLEIFGISCIERSSSWNHDYKWLRDLSLVLNQGWSMTSNEYKAIWLWSVLGTHLALKFVIKTKQRRRWSLSTYDWKSSW